MSGFNNGEFKDNIENYSRDAGKKIGEIASEFNQKSEDYVKSGQNYLKENPVQSLLIAAAVGVVVGSALTMMFRKNKNERS